MSFMKSHLLLTKLWLKTEKTLKLRQSKGNNSYTTDDTPMKLHMHNHPMVIYIKRKFLEISFIGYQVMAEEGKNHWNLGNQRAITPLWLMTPWKNFTCITTSWSYIFSISFMKFHPLVTTKNDCCKCLNHFNWPLHCARVDKHWKKWVG